MIYQKQMSVIFLFIGLSQKTVFPTFSIYLQCQSIFKVVRYVTFSNCRNWRSIKIFIYSYNTIRQPPGSRIEKRQCDVIMTSLAPQKDHPKNDVFDRFSGIKRSKNFRFFSKKHTCCRKKYSVFNGCYLIYDASLIMIGQTFYQPNYC